MTPNDSTIINSTSTGLVRQVSLHDYHRRRNSVDIVDCSNDNDHQAEQIPNDSIRQLDDAIVANAMSHTPTTCNESPCDEHQPNFVLYDKPAYLWKNTDPKPYMSSSHVDGGMSPVFDWLYLGARSNAGILYGYDMMLTDDITNILY